MDESKVVSVRRRDQKGFVQWLLELQEAIVEGYRIDGSVTGVRCGHTFAPSFRCTLSTPEAIERKAKEAEALREDAIKAEKAEAERVSKEEAEKAEPEVETPTQESPVEVEELKDEPETEAEAEAEAEAPKEEVEKAEPEVEAASTEEVAVDSVQALLDDPKAKKAELVYLAEAKGIEIPESAKSPAAIKKIIRSSVES